MIVTEEDDLFWERGYSKEFIIEDFAINDTDEKILRRVINDGLDPIEMLKKFKERYKIKI